jgi:hypothetical protein
MNISSIFADSPCCAKSEKVVVPVGDLARVLDAPADGRRSKGLSG